VNKYLFLAVILSVSLNLKLLSQEKKWNSSLRGELRSVFTNFYDDFPDEDKLNNYGAFSIEGEWTTFSKGNDKQFVIEPFFRYAYIDKSRTHFDMRQLYYAQKFGGFTLSVGVKQVLWGYLDGFSIVNMFNQADELEEPLDGEKLGQAVIEGNYAFGNNDISVYYTPLFRPKQYPDFKSRSFLFPFELKDDELKELEFSKPALAVRMRRILPKVELAASYYFGTYTIPAFFFDPSDFTLGLDYREVHQLGLEGQYAFKSLLVKSEAAYRKHDGFDDSWAIGFGLEYTFSNVFRSGIELAPSVEVSYDQFKKDHGIPFHYTIFYSLRADFGDIQSSELNVRLITLPDDYTTIWNIDFSRRVFSYFEVLVASNFFFVDNKRTSEFNPIFPIQYNSNINLQIAKYF